MGSIVLEGQFVSSMSMAATVIKSRMEDIDSILRRLVRDDIVSWYTSKSMAKSDIKTQELVNQLGDRVATNVAVVQSKISECSVQLEPKEASKLKTQPVNQRHKTCSLEHAHTRDLQLWTPVSSRCYRRIGKFYHYDSFHELLYRILFCH
jgi:hypothetical protein